MTEFADLTTSEFVSWYIGYKRNNVRSDLKSTHIKNRDVYSTFFLVQHSGEWLNMESRNLLPGVACSTGGSSRSAQSLCPCSRATSASSCSEHARDLSCC